MRKYFLDAMKVACVAWATISGFTVAGCGTSVESTPAGVDTPTETSSPEHAAGEKASEKQVSKP